MKGIKLKFIGLGCGNYLQANVKIYDSDCNLIYDDRTYNGQISILLNVDQCYKVIAYCCYGYINVWFYVDKNRDCYKFCFNTVEDNSITFLLTDYYYSNLPIEKGEIILWQR